MLFCLLFNTIFAVKEIKMLALENGRVDRASATETVDSGSIPGRVKPKTIKVGIHKLPCLTFSN